MIVNYVIYIYITAKGVYREGKGAVPPLDLYGGRCSPPRTQSFHTFQILNSRVKNITKISLLFIQCTKKNVYVEQSHHDRSPNEKSILNAHSS